MAQENDISLTVIGVVLAFIVAFSVISYFWLGPMIFFEQREAGEEIAESTYDAESAVQIYEEFRKLHNDIEAQRNQVENSYDELDRFYEVHGDPRSEDVNPNEDWSRTTQERHNRIQQRITGNQNQLENLVAEYNTMSDQANKEIFKCNLPYQVDDQMYITGPPGSDAPEQPQDVGPDGEVIDGEPAEPEECDGLRLRQVLKDE